MSDLEKHIDQARDLGRAAAKALQPSVPANCLRTIAIVDLYEGQEEAAIRVLKAWQGGWVDQTAEMATTAGRTRS